MSQRRDTGQVLISDAVAGGAELAGDAAHMHRVPDRHRIRYQAQATGLVHDFLIVASTEAALIGEEYPFGEDVAELSAVKLHLDRLPQFHVVDVA